MQRNSCVLRPPATRVLRDNVIGGVVQRTERNNAAYATTTAAWDRRCVSPEGTTAAAVDGQFSPTDRKRKRQEPTSLPASNKLMLLAVSSSGAALYSKPEPQFKGASSRRRP